MTLARDHPKALLSDHSVLTGTRSIGSYPEITISNYILTRLTGKTQDRYHSLNCSFVKLSKGSQPAVNTDIMGCDKKGATHQDLMGGALCFHKK
jgi:hypothetical protein